MENYHESFFRESREAVFVTTVDGWFLDMNPAALALFGFEREEMLTLRVVDIYMRPEDRAQLMDIIEKTGFLKDEPVAMKKKDGTELHAEITSTARRDESGTIIGYQGVIRDVTIQRRAAEDRQELEEQLRQSQKMEAIGRLAGGVAHDFNNLLMAIAGYADLIHKDLPEDDALRDYASQIRRAADRGAALTQQLLAFGRQQVLRPRRVDPREVIVESVDLLRQLIGEHIQLVTEFGDELWPVVADPNQWNQVLVNLAINARDAMPKGGNLTIGAANMVVDSGFSDKHDTVENGEFVVFAIRDTGQGMSEETLARIFEPFFSTKELGSGLGLATVFGIVKQSGGNILVDSEPNRGTTFRIFLPRAKGPARPMVLPDAGQSKQTVLVMEDDPELRDFICTALRKEGYLVIPAGSGADGVRAAEECFPAIVISDVVMPGMSGPEAVRSILGGNPDAKVIYMSAYPQKSVPGSPFLQKPFGSPALLQMVRDLLRPADSTRD